LTETVYVSGGSNVDVERNLLIAARELRRRFPGVVFSRCYRNESVGFEGPAFVNFCAAFPLAGSIDDVKAALEAIEALCGRPPNAPKWEPRQMDLDIVLVGERIADVPVKLPRPQLLKWAFMLGPLAEIAPDAVHPLERRTIWALWADFDHGAHPMQVLALDLAQA
jgi:2-amino-4-hydroxy-6-hydroxymethyldihydropteridine diphosphokinase